MKRLLKKAAAYILLHSLVINDMSIEFYTYILNNSLQYCIRIIYQYNTFSLCNSDSFEYVFNKYISLINKVKNNIFAESVKKQKIHFIEKAKQLLYNEAQYKYQKQHTLYNIKPLFLGISEVC